MPVTCTCGWMSAGLVAVTVTPGSTAPVLSVTVPLMRPRKSWAYTRVCVCIPSSGFVVTARRVRALRRKMHESAP
jgi:hypothetical protein